MDSENKKNEENDALSFEEQLAELIKQSGGSVPPKTSAPQDGETIVINNPHDEDEPIIIAASAANENEAPVSDGPVFSETLVTDEPIGVYSGPQTVDKTPEQIEAELSALINDFADKESAEFANLVTPDVSVDDKPQNGENELKEIKDEIAELEKDITETQIAALQKQLKEQAQKAQAEKEQAAESYRLDYELERMLNSFEDETVQTEEKESSFETPDDSALQAKLDEMLKKEKEQLEAQSAAAMEAKLDEMLKEKAQFEAQSAAAMEAKLDELLKEKAQTETQNAAAMEAKLDELLKEGREKDAKIEELLKAEQAKREEKAQIEMQQMLDKIASLESILAQKEKPQENADVIADENIEIVPPDQTRDTISSAEAEKVAAMEAKLDELLNANKQATPDPAAVTEMEQMRAKIASLEYMLAQKPKENTAATSATGTGMPTGDINTMFKQWFDLEMAAKMKTLILPEEKKKESENAQNYDVDANQGSDFIKLSDNVFYNVKEKKTYIMKELSPTPSLPAARPTTKKPTKQTKPIKHKPAAKKKGLLRKKKRPAVRNRALRPRRPKSAARRPKR